VSDRNQSALVPIDCVSRTELSTSIGIAITSTDSPLALRGRELIGIKG